jgi:hypothetical protein
MDSSLLMSKEIKTGNSVSVKPGVKDPDYDYDLSGWQGRVIHIDTHDEEFIEIAWDSVTLGQMPARLIETSIEEGFEFYLMWLNENDIVLAEPRDQPAAVDDKINALNKQFGYMNSEEQHQQIKQILNSKDLSVSKENLDKFYNYLSKHIKYPCLLTGMEDFSWEEPYVLGIFDQEEYEILKKKRASYIDHFKLIRLEDRVDDLQGILVNVQRIGDRKLFILPLWDLKTVDRKDQNHHIIDNYSFWMTNYR